MERFVTDSPAAAPNKATTQERTRSGAQRKKVMQQFFCGTKNYGNTPDPECVIQAVVQAPVVVLANVRRWIARHSFDDLPQTAGKHVTKPGMFRVQEQLSAVGTHGDAPKQIRREKNAATPPAPDASTEAPPDKVKGYATLSAVRIQELLRYIVRKTAGGSREGNLTSILNELGEVGEDEKRVGIPHSIYHAWLEQSLRIDRQVADGKGNELYVIQRAITRGTAKKTKSGLLKKKYVPPVLSPEFRAVPATPAQVQKDVRASVVTTVETPPSALPERDPKIAIPELFACKYGAWTPEQKRMFVDQVRALQGLEPTGAIAIVSELYTVPGFMYALWSKAIQQK